MSGIYIPAMKPEDWSRFLAEPKHWKKGYSAMSLAMCWQEADGFPDSVTTVFKQSDFMQLHDIELLLAIPEHKVPLPGGSAASQSDLFVLAKGGGQLFSITVEGKVSEPFGDKYINDWYKDPSPGRMKRLELFVCLAGSEDRMRFLTSGTNCCIGLHQLYWKPRGSMQKMP